MKKLLLPVLICLSLLLTGCKGDAPVQAPPKKITVVTTLFPLYDFARTIGGERVEVSLLLPPGTEPHGFEPKPADLLKLNRADIFIFTNRYMEPWAAGILGGVDNARLKVVDAGSGVTLAEEKDHDEKDPHIWLDFRNAVRMADTITEAMIGKDPDGRKIYEKNSSGLKASLIDLDRRYEERLKTCPKRIFVSGGHLAFSYLARRYGLTYRSAYGFSPNAEPSAKELMALSRYLRKQGLSHLYHEELILPRVAETIARESGATLLFLHGAHNISRDDLEKGATFVSLMNINLDQLATGLQCPPAKP